MSGDLVLINALREYALDMNKKNTLKENEAKARREYLKKTDIKEQMEQEWTKEDIEYLVEIGKISIEAEKTKP